MEFEQGQELSLYLSVIFIETSSSETKILNKIIWQETTANRQLNSV